MDLHRRSQLPAVVLEDKIMIWKILAITVAALIVVVLYVCLIAAGQADRREEKWFDDERRSNQDT